MLRKTSKCAAALMLVWCAMGSQAYAQVRTNGVLVKLHESSAIKAISNADRARSLSAVANAPVRVDNGPAPDMRLVKSADGSQSDVALAEALAASPDVELAAPNQLKRLHATPNDPLFASEQWNLKANDYAAIRATGAWDITTGSASVPVAVVDSGVRLDHPDLAANFLPGYDFVDMTSDPSDPGDGDPLDPDCRPTSSWHGTAVSGFVAGIGNNGQGIAGLNWAGRIVPVRVSGACSAAYDSDIIAGIRWAAGLPSIAGVPDNPNPVKVINLSIGGWGTCREIANSPYSSPYPALLRDLTAKGVMLVVSAGNGSSNVVDEPANCDGAIGVGAVTAEGYKTDYSSFGPEVTISAPGGSCDAALCKTLTTTTNLGTTTPGANGYSSSKEGTSFSAPQVTGVIALMLAANPSLTPDEVKTILKETARPFPQNPAKRECSGANVYECNCTTSTCGAGILDAEAAVRRAKEHVSPQPAPQPQPDPDKKDGGGGAADWLALAGLLALAAGRKRVMRKA